MAGRQWTCERIHADRKAGGGLWRHLRRRGKKPDRKGGRHSGRGRIPGRVDISERPAAVEAKERVGDREADTPRTALACSSRSGISLPETGAVRRAHSLPQETGLGMVLL